VIHDYDTELGQTRADVARLHSALAREPDDVSGATRLLYRRYHLATLAGQVDDLPALRHEVEDAIGRLGLNGDLCLLTGQIDFTLHRFSDVVTDLERVVGLAHSRPARALLADARLRQGHVAEARTELEELLDPPSWDVLSRLAGLLDACGDDLSADRAYAAAQEELSAKQMRAFAWLELKRGSLALRRGREGDAEDHYDRADRAYSGYWLVDEHFAGLAVARGRLDAAEARLRRVVMRVPRPTARQELGRVLEQMGRRTEAESHYAAALDAYKASAAAGEVHYLHHLVDFYTTVHIDLAAAARWADADATASSTRRAMPTTSIT